MSDATDSPPTLADRRLAPAVDHIATVQREDGLVPWFPDGPADPWDHVESAMALSVAGRETAAVDAYRWLARNQLADGSWWASYLADEDEEKRRRESHRSAYVAVGVWHHYLRTGDARFLDELWPTVDAAIEFALSLQQPGGEVYWAVDADGEPDDEVLVAGCASVYLSLTCGLDIARELGVQREGWREARERLGSAMRAGGGSFGEAWEPKATYAMYWYYPVLCGVFTGDMAADRLAAEWDRFVEPGLGCRCVSDEPWVTVAESAELVLALAATGQRGRAGTLYDWLTQWRDDDGVFWTGYQFADGEIWPRERPTWTSGAVVLAADALGGVGPTADFFGPRG